MAMLLLLLAAHACSAVLVPSPSTLFTQGLSHLAAGELAQAATALRQSLEFDPTPEAAGAFHAASEALLEQGDFATAEECYRFAVESDPHNAGQLQRKATPTLQPHQTVHAHPQSATRPPATAARVKPTTSPARVRLCRQRCERGWRPA